MSYPLITLSLARLRQEDLLREAAEARRAARFQNSGQWSSIRPILSRLAASLYQAADRPRLIHSPRGQLGTTPTA